MALAFSTIFFTLAFAMSLIPSTIRASSADYYDSLKTISEYVMSHNCSFAIHKAVTDDGYILTLWRIQAKSLASQPPVLLMHGLMDNSFGWLFKVWERNLPAVLVEAGFDVWIGNNRGNINSLEHIDRARFDWSNSGNRFWDFSVDEFGKYDFPAMVELICKVTGYPRIHYVGHSLGVKQFFINAMLGTEYVNRRIRSMIGLGPSLFSGPLSGSNASTTGTKIGLFFLDLMRWVGLKNFWVSPSTLPFNSWFIRQFPMLMVHLVRLICGATNNQTMDTSRLGVCASGEPGGTSVQALMHSLQQHTRPGLHMFDFGEAGNEQHYGGLKVPPRYDHEKLRGIRIPIYLVMGTKDKIELYSGWEDMLRLLPKDSVFEMIDDYAHLDYRWADNAHVVLYPRLVQFMKSHDLAQA